MITRQQLRAARGFLGWDRHEVARRSGVSVGTLKNIEAGRTQPHAATVELLEKLFRDNDIEFPPNGGLCPRDNTLRVIDEGNPYLQLLDDVFATLKDVRRAEVLFCFVRNEMSPAEVVASDLRLRQIGIRFRSLIEEGDSFCLYPLREYRCVPRRFFQNNTQVIYGNKVGSMIGGNRKAVIINNVDYAETQRGIFNALWESSKGRPTKSTAPKTYG